MEKSVAEALVRNFLQRVVRNDFRLSDEIGELERAAIREIAGLIREGMSHEDISGSVGDTAPSQPTQNPVTAPDIDLSCLASAPEANAVVGLDFGTAFSKTSVWVRNAAHPIPLELAKSAAGQRSLLLESTLYFSDARKVHFGPQAIEISQIEDNPERARFDSPKQRLSIEGVEGLSSRAEAAIDPTRSFSKRDLLTLFLAYLNATVSDQLSTLGFRRHLQRRFAIPVWNTVQLSETSRVLAQMLLDGQILADSIPMETWRAGLPVATARAALDALRRVLPDDDERRQSEGLIGQHVLEASAAAAAIGEKLQNRRPVALVMDVGAGTTDIGLFWFVFPDDAAGHRPKIAPFKDGSMAKKIAGDRLDKLLIEFIRAKASLSDGDPVLFRVIRDIRDIKRDLVETGARRIEGIDDVDFQLSEFATSEGVREYKQELRAAVSGLLAQFGASRVKGRDGVFAVLTGGGSKFPIFTTFFEEPFDTGDGSVKFRVIDAQPDWLSQLDPAYAPVFGQLAVALGASAPDLPSEVHAISGLPPTELTIMGLPPMYAG